jgi:hypothetical protein
MRYVDFVQPHVSTLAHILSIHLKCDSREHDNRILECILCLINYLDSLCLHNILKPVLRLPSKKESKIAMIPSIW